MGNFFKYAGLILVATVGCCAVVVVGFYMSRWATSGTVSDVRDIAVDTVKDTINAVGSVLTEAELRSVQEECIRRYGVEKGNQIYERVVYLDQLFAVDTFREIMDAVAIEGNRRTSEGEEFDMTHAYYLLAERAQSAGQGRFVAFLAANTDVFEASRTKKLDKVFAAEPEGMNESPIRPKDTYYHSKIDPETGEPVTAQRSATPGIVYAPVEQESDPGFNTRKVTPGY